MRKISFLLLLAACPFVLKAQPAGASGSWELVFEDQFTGSALDASKWSKGYPWGDGTTHNHEAYCIPENVTVENGLLRIKAVSEKHPASPEGYNWTSGVVSTSGKFHVSAGFIEGRFKAPATLGTWPAFWTLGDGWPPEIDILEIPHARNVHHYYYHYGPSWDQEQSFGGTHTGVDKSAGFHTYGVEWDTNYMHFYFDGQLVASYNNRPEVAQAVNQYILINLAVGGWAGAPPAGAQFPCYFECDWVRVWKRKPGIASGEYRISPAHASNQAVEMANHGTENGTNVATWSYWGGPNQRWNVNDLGGGYYSIRPVNAPAQSMDIEGQSIENGANVASWSYWGGHNQQFELVANGNGYVIKPRNSGRCLDVSGASTQNGANIIQWTCNGGANQRFIMTRLGDLKSGSLTEAPPLEVSASAETLQVSPNPVTGDVLVLRTTLPFSSDLVIEFFNLQGQRMKVLNKGRIEKGALAIEANVGDLAPGTYVLTLEVDGLLKRAVFVKK